MELEARIQKLEADLTRANRYLKVGIISVLAISVFTLVGVGRNLSIEPKEVRASAFLLEDGKGNVRAALALSGEEPSLKLMDQAGKARLRVLIDKHGPGLQLCDEQEKLRAELAHAPTYTRLTCWDDSLKPRVTVGVTQAMGGPAIMMLDGSMNIRMRLSVPDSGPRIDFLDETTRERLRLDASDDGPRLELKDKAGVSRASLMLGQDGAIMKLADHDGKLFWGSEKR